MELTAEQRAELAHTPEQIVKFVREARGEAEADRVANNFESLAFWDAKIEDWATD